MAVAALTLLDEALSPCDHGDPGPHPTCVGGAALQVDGKPVHGWRTHVLVQVHRVGIPDLGAVACAARRQHHIEVAIPIEVGHGQPRGAGVIETPLTATQLFEGAVGLLLKHERVLLGVVAGADEQVGTGVQVQIDDGRADAAFGSRTAHQDEPS